MFDGLVQEVNTRTDVGGRAGTLVRTVLSYIVDEEPGGLNAFLDRFRRSGLGDLVTSWMGNTSPRELTPAQVDGALGGLVRKLADRSGLSVAQVTPALALMLPKLIGMLTPDRKVPSSIPAGVSSWLGQSARTVGTYGEPAATAAGTYRAESVGTYGAPVREPAAPVRSTAWAWLLLPLLGLGLGALLWAVWPTHDRVATEPSALVKTPDPVKTDRVPAVVAPAPTPRAVADLWPTKVYFAVDSTNIGGDQSARIQRVAEHLKANPGTVVDIAGYADATGMQAANVVLAEKRARAVRDALIAAGVPPSQTKLAPSVEVPTGGDEAEARRAEIRPSS